MASELTVKERAFAELIVQGTKSEAYRTVYSAKGSRATQATNAYKLSRKPKIKTEVARLLQQRAFPADDYKRLQETAIAGMTEIFLYDPDSRVRLKAGGILLAYADAGLKLHPEPSADGSAYDPQKRAAIIEELKMIYEKAGIPRQVRDATCERREVINQGTKEAVVVEPAEEESEPLVEVAVEGPEGGNDEVQEPGESATLEGGFGAEPVNRGVQFRWENIPGYHPPKYRRVRVES